MVMVTFKDDDLIISLKTGAKPTETWLELHEQLVFLLTMCSEQDNYDYDPFMVNNLVSALMPDLDTANKMIAK